jgi:predicted ATP-dependent serine protease
MVWRCFQCGDSYDDRPAFCAGCGQTGSVYQLGRRARAEIDSALEIASAADLVRQANRVEQLAGCPGVMVGGQALVVLAGPPGSGKSSLATRILDGTPGPVIYVSVEEAPGPSLGQRLARLGVKRADFGVIGWGDADQVAAVLRNRRCVAVCIDSVQVAHWHARELRHLLAVLPALRLVVAVSQVNKRGEIAGTNELLHEADVALEVADMSATLVKSRFQPVQGDSNDKPIRFPVLLPVLPSAIVGDEVRLQREGFRKLRLLRDAPISEGAQPHRDAALPESPA